jgi:hypothetical protein
MIVQARHCKICQEVFLPVAEFAGSLTQCPHCSGQMLVGECEPAKVLQSMPEQEYRPVDEEDEARRVRGLRHERWTRILIRAGVVCAVVLAALMVWQFQRGESDEAKKEAAQVAALTKAEMASQRDLAEIRDVARRVLAAKTLEEILPDVAGAAQAKDLLAWYFNRVPFNPETLTKVDSVETLDMEERELRRVCVSTATRPVVWMVMVREGAGWKLNWELYSNAHVDRWRAFLREAPGATVELPLLVVKKPAPEAYIARAGAGRDTHDAVLLCAGNRDDLAGALLPVSSPLWKDLPRISFEEAEKVIARVTLLDPRADPPLTRLDAVVQHGWVRGTQKPVAGKAPPP